MLFLTNLECKLIVDSDIIASLVIRVLLYSSAFQHASTQGYINQTYQKVSDLAHKAVVGAAIDLSAEMQRIREKYKLGVDMDDFPVGSIICFEQEYFCNYILMQETFPIRESCKSNLSLVSNLLSDISVNKVKSILVEGDHCFILSGKFEKKRENQHKQFWILTVSLWEITRCSMEISRGLSL